MRKPGVNFHDKNQIMKFHREGRNVAQIAALVRVEDRQVARIIKENCASDEGETTLGAQEKPVPVQGSSKPKPKPKPKQKDVSEQ